MGNVEIKFPVESLPNWLKDYVIEVSREYQTPPEMIFQSCLAAMSYATRNCWTVRTAKRYTETLQLWTMTIAEPGERKGVMNEAFSAIRSLEVDAQTVWQKEIFHYKEVDEPRKKLLKKEIEELQKEIRELEKQDEITKEDNQKIRKLGEKVYNAAEELKKIKEPVFPTYICTDTTVEGLQKVLGRNHETLAIADTEATFLKVVGGLYNAKGTENLGFLNKCYVSEPHASSRAGSEVTHVLRLPFLSIGLFVQPNALNKMMSSDFTGTGFLQRFLFSMPESNLGYRETNPEPASNSTREVWSSMLTSLFEYSTAMRIDQKFESKSDLPVLQFTFEAEQVYRQFVKNFEPRYRLDGDLGGEIGQWASKFPGTIARIAANLAVMEGQRENVELSHLEAALDLSEFYIENAKRIWGVMSGATSVGRQADRKKAVLLKWIFNNAKRRADNESQTEKFTASKVHQNVRQWKDSPFKDLDTEKAQKLITQTLELMMNETENHWLTPVDPPKIGRQTPAYTANIPLMLLEYGINEA